MGLKGSSVVEYWLEGLGMVQVLKVDDTLLGLCC